MRSVIVLFLLIVFHANLVHAQEAWVHDEKLVKVSVVHGDYGQISLRIDKAPADKADHVLFEQQGYWTAKDRFIQMDFTRRTANATLSEIFGEKALERDTTVLSVGIPRATEQTLNKLINKFPHVYDLLKSYTNGVNRFLSELEQSHPTIVRFYRQLTHDPTYLPAKWKPEDSLAVQTSLEFYLSSSMEQKLLFGAIFYSVLGADGEKLENFFDLRPLENEFILGPPVEAKKRTPTTTPKAKMMKRKPISLKYAWKDMGYPFSGPGFAAGSNSWVVSRKFAGGKSAYLANDPHLPMFFPSTFKEIAIDSTPAKGTFRVKGMSVPGMPGIFIGHNDHIAWGLTNILADVDDVYIETTSYRGKKTKFLGQEIPIKKKRYFVKVRNKKGKLYDKVVVIRWVPHHGPIISDYIPGLVLPPNILLSYRWVGHEGSAGMAAIVGLNRAKNYSLFKDAMKYWEVGAQNIVYADVEGNIAYYAPGKYPIRPDPTRVVAPYIPVPGNGSYEWEGYRTKMPELYNPKSGRIVTANNDPYGKNAFPNLSQYDDYFSFRFVVGARAKRITTLLDLRKSRINVSTLQRIQMDHKDLVALKIIALIRKARKTGGLSKLSPEAIKFANRLLRWNGQVVRDSPEAAEFIIWFTFVMEEHFSIVKDAGLLKPLLNTYSALQTTYHKLLQSLNMNPEYAHRVIERSLERAKNWMKKISFGPIRWGDIHRLEFLPPLTGLLDESLSVPIERDGSWFSIDVGGYRVGNIEEVNGHNKHNFYGPNFRMILVLEKGKPIRGFAVSSAGASGSFEPFTMVQELVMWRDGKLRDLVSFVP